MSTLRILITGEINGNFTKFTQKLRQLANKSSFDFCLSLGEFYGDSDNVSSLLNVNNQENSKDALKLPLPVFEMSKKLPEEILDQLQEKRDQVCHNLHHLDNFGYLKTKEGVKLAWIREATEEAMDGLMKLIGNQVNTHVDEPVETDGVTGIDILLLGAVPSQITSLTNPTTLSGTPLPNIPPTRYSENLNNLLKIVRPRYCFAPSPIKLFWEREPYTNDSVKNSWATRFIMLGSLSDVKDEKWIYAFSLVPLSNIEAGGEQDKMIRLKPSNATPLPFSTSVKRPQSTEGEVSLDKPEEKKQRQGPPDSYTCHKCGQKGHWIKSCPQKAVCKVCHQPGHKPMDCPQKRNLKECWFCLSNPQVLTHLIFSLGQETYLTLPRGQLCQDHLLIVPIVHHASTNHLIQAVGEEEETAMAIRKEMWKFWDGVNKMQHCNDRKVVGFEVFGGVDVGQANGVATKRPQQHLHLQLVPVPTKLNDDAIQQAFEEAAKEADLDIVHEFPATLTDPYIHVFFGDHLDRMDDDNGEAELKMGRRHLILLAKPGWENKRKGPFNFQLPRKVLAELLGVPEKVDWKKCMEKDQDAETEVTEKVKKRWEEGGWGAWLE